MSLEKAINKDRLRFNLKEVKEFIKNNSNSKIYFGCDSIKLKKNVKFATVVCIHYEGHKGAKIFGKITYKNIIDNNLSKPINRMIEEVNCIINIYSQLEETLINRIEDVSIHLDINPNKNAGSNIAYGAAKGMIEGIIGLEPIFKPEAFSASFAADRYCHLN